MKREPRDWGAVADIWRDGQVQVLMLSVKDGGGVDRWNGDRWMIHHVVAGQVCLEDGPTIGPWASVATPPGEPRRFVAATDAEVIEVVVERSVYEKVAVT